MINGGIVTGIVGGFVAKVPAELDPEHRVSWPTRFVVTTGIGVRSQIVNVRSASRIRDRKVAFVVHRGATDSSAHADAQSNQVLARRILCVFVIGKRASGVVIVNRAERSARCLPRDVGTNPMRRNSRNLIAGTFGASALVSDKLG